MKKHLRKAICLLAVLIVMAASTATTFAGVTYEGQASNFIFTPGSDYSKTDLFDEMYKGVIPGDSFIDTITVRNEASDKVNVEIFMRALGATDLVDPDDGQYDVSQEESAAFLEHIELTVTHENGTEVFSGKATETSDWVSLGKFKSGDEVDLDIVLNVLPTLTAQDQIGAIDWQFKVIETPVPSETKTGDDMNLILPIALMGIAALSVIILLVAKRKQEK